MYLYFIVLLVSLFESTRAVHRVSENLRKKLDAEERNALCCRYNLRCCRQIEKTVAFELKAVITDCPNLQCSNWTTSSIVVHHNKTVVEKLTECRQKLLLTIKMIRSGLPSSNSQYVIVDHITDAATLKKVRILNPYAVRIRQNPVLQVYGLKFEKTVNAEARERIINKQDRNYRGCNTALENPTCGVVQHEGKAVPYSTGFCCSCNPEKNRLMEEQGKQVQWPLDVDVPEYHKNHPDGNDYEHYKHYGFTGQDGKMVYGRSQKRADKSVNYQQFTELKDGKIRQRRGGQSCDDVEFDNLPESFHESTHCLTFSNLWYSIYTLNKPKVVHRLRIQIFQKYEDCHGKTHWMDLTQGKVVEIGTHQCTYVDKDFIAKYSSKNLDENDSPLDYQNFKMIIPEKRVVDPDQFMMLPKKLVTEDGKSCDTPGVGYEAFYKQKKRCSSPPGSCLNNQPRQLYESDIQAEQEGRPGNYFVKYFGTLAEDPVGYNAAGQVQYLKMVHTKTYVNNLYIELNADLVTLLKPNAFATITEVYTDATNPYKTQIVVKVTNSGLLYGVFYVRLTGCPLSVPASFNNIASKSVVISPQHQHIFNLFIEYHLPVKELFCSIHVHNINQELVAVRHVRVRSYDRCICIWHCECACYVADKGLKCIPMSLDDYHAAGFQGGLSTPASLIESSYLDEMYAMLFNMIIFVVLTLLAMGLVKALLGLCSQEISMWGLATILGIEKPDILCDNKECEFRTDIGISVAGQFCMNVLFFFLYPMALFNICIRKLCFSTYTMEDDARSTEEKWINYESCEDVCAKSTRSTVATEKSGISLNYTPSERSGETDGKYEDKTDDKSEM